VAATPRPPAPRPPCRGRCHRRRRKRHTHRRPWPLTADQKAVGAWPRPNPAPLPKQQHARRLGTSRPPPLGPRRPRAPRTGVVRRGAVRRQRAAAAGNRARGAARVAEQHVARRVVQPLHARGPVALEVAQALGRGEQVHAVQVHRVRPPGDLRRGLHARLQQVCRARGPRVGQASLVQVSLWPAGAARGSPRALNGAGSAAAAAQLRAPCPQWAAAGSFVWPEENKGG